MGHPRMLTPRILWFALFVSQFLYLGMLLMPGVVPPGQVFHIDSRGLGILEYTKGVAQA